MMLLLALLLADPAEGTAVAPPAKMNWYWYRPAEAAHGTNAQDTGAAFVAVSFDLTQSAAVRVNYRREPLRLPAGTYRMAVVRIEHRDAKFTPAQRTQLAAMIAEVPAVTRTRALQIDFDAPESAWPFYKTLLSEVRRAIGPGVFLSMTALASWCTQQSWMAGATVDEIVPMFFRMGRTRIEPPLAFSGCQASAGISVDEPAVRLPSAVRRIYTFR